MKRAHPFVWGVAGSALTIGVVCGVALVPTTWRKSIGHEVVEFRVPLGVKLAAFVYRDWMYRHLVAEATRGVSGDLARVNALFDWTVAHIQTEIPAGWVVEDDHPLHVIIRGYGVDWQVADVFTLLCSYAGYPATMASAKPTGRPGRLILALVYLRGEWRVFDPYYRNRFVLDDGLPVSLPQLQTNPELARLAAHQPVIKGLPYLAYFDNVRSLESGEFLRPHRHMVWPRVWHELGQWGRRLLGGAA